jgi:hypothetical protein
MSIHLSIESTQYEMMWRRLMPAGQDAAGFDVPQPLVDVGSEEQFFQNVPAMESLGNDE